MFSTELSSEFRSVVREIIPRFEEKLKRAFKNEAVRLQRKNSKRSFIHSISDVFLSKQSDTKICLYNMKFHWMPDFRIHQMSADLPMQCLHIKLFIGAIKIEGEYEASNLTLQKLLPLSLNGKILMIFNDVKIEGKIGLFIKEDSFVPLNYDISYTISDVSIRVNYYVIGENEIENEINNTNLEETLAATVWTRLTAILTKNLHQQLSKVVAEFSLNEILLNHDEELREYAREQSFRANRLLDSVLCSAKDFLVAKYLRRVQTPAFNVIYKGKLPGMLQGELRTSEGFIQDLSTLTRLQDFSLFENKHNLEIFGLISLREFKHGYDNYESECDGTKINGKISTLIGANKIFVKIVVKKEGKRCKSQLSSIKVEGIEDVDIDISGLASLTWLAPKLKSWVIGNFHHEAVPVLEKYIQESFEHAINKIDCVALLID